ncbi:HNH endonuclease [Tenacibaculum finnmarkense]|uniref:HNH endonuclease n=1 Tax=Tenacibaculum finnmarkense TaxID=2781243 RepID=UPI001EFB5AB4|nr:HNH endonuclease [Tenacibaculum finnmarkense]MCG8860020.1 HNH endonuclease [Tenacibaculum finnmarkense]
MNLKCLWCLNEEPKVTFEKKAHTIPKSLGGQNYNKNVCDNCNAYFGNRDNNNNNNNRKYSIEEALKEGFNISRKMLLNSGKSKRKIGRFKSKFFDIKEKNGKYRLTIKSSFRFTSGFQKELCRAFKRGLYKMFFEELNRQKDIGYETKFDIIRQYSRYDIGELPVLYFNRLFGSMILLKSEAETPILLFDRMNYLYSNDKFTEIEFLGHVFGLPISEVNEKDFENYIKESINYKEGFFKDAVIIQKMTDIDIAMKIMND